MWPSAVFAAVPDAHSRQPGYPVPAHVVAPTMRRPHREGKGKAGAFSGRVVVRIVAKRRPIPRPGDTLSLHAGPARWLEPNPLLRRPVRRGARQGGQGVVTPPPVSGGQAYPVAAAEQANGLMHRACRCPLASWVRQADPSCSREPRGWRPRPGHARRRPRSTRHPRFRWPERMRIIDFQPRAAAGAVREAPGAIYVG